MNTDIPHRVIAAKTFNEVWDLLDKPTRTEAEDQEMVHLCHTSLWHWTQVPTHTDQHLSIGYWQLSRVYSVIQEGERALHYAKQSHHYSVRGQLDSFYKGYSLEALARSASLLGLSEAEEYLKEAFTYANEVSDSGNQTLLLEDLEELSSNALTE
ncbi:hypothetical protein N781_13305 [Pontibacillus halophilus JSM 076056 = DSM 19796]|uniref:Uncharacterized protein n=1 Tax=Pontibacillus halophilus JSM 076056 = DSM 19796 TaxID=1385510 RepID=A0A0A5GLI1_9BACI|nr:hypothetical protein [Pontibacillus halophilus]KGX92864.1 hypothetical protein N781_13305 [Pontibacillus halophilus JSM 076056 = DSM 19796]